PPSHVRAPDAVRRLYLHVADGAQDALVTEVSYKRLLELQRDAGDVIDLAGFVQNPVVAGEGEEAREIRGAIVSPNLFSMLGVRPHLGRFLSAADPNDVVLGFDWWRNAYGADSGVLGRTIRIGTERFNVVGIAPANFSGVDVGRVDAWIPTTAARAIWTHLGPQWTNEHNFSFLSLAGRLRD